MLAIFAVKWHNQGGIYAKSLIMPKYECNQWNQLRKDIYRPGC